MEVPPSARVGLRASVTEHVMRHSRHAAILAIAFALAPALGLAQTSFEITLDSGQRVAIEKWRKAVSPDGRLYVSFAHTAGGKLDPSKARKLGKDIWAVLAPKIQSENVCYASLTLWEPLDSASGVSVYMYTFLNLTPNDKSACRP